MSESLLLASLAALTLFVHDSSPAVATSFAAKFDIEVMVDFEFMNGVVVLKANIDGFDCGTTGNTITPPSEIWPRFAFGARTIVDVASDAERVGCGAVGRRIEWTVNGRPADQSTPWPTEAGLDRLLLTVGGVPMVLTGRLFHAEGLTGDESVSVTVGGRTCGRGGFGRAAPTGVGGVDAYGAIVLPYTADPHCGRDGDRVLITIAGRPATESIVWREGRQQADLILADPEALASAGDEHWEWLAAGFAAGAVLALSLVFAASVTVRRIRSS